MRYQGRHNIEVTTTRCEMRGALMSDELFSFGANVLSLYD